MSMSIWKTTILTAVAAAGMVQAQTRVKTQTSLYERLGGMPAVHAVVDDLVNRILGDERVNKWFARAAADADVAAAYKAGLADFLCQGTGGPCKYAGPDMLAAHKGRGITEAAFQAVVEDLVATLDKLHVPAKEKADVLNLLGPMKPLIVQ
jgi:hemoglobin